MLSLLCCPVSSFSQVDRPSPSHKFPNSPRFQIPLSFTTSLDFGYPPNPHSLPGKGFHFHAIRASDQQKETQFQPPSFELSSNGRPINTSPSISLLSFLCPLLKFFSGGDPSSDRNYIFEDATSSLSSLTRILWGSRAKTGSLKSRDSIEIDPPLPLQLYEFEACPFCRRVREAMTELDLSVEIYPCPKGSTKYRKMVRRLGGKEQFPFLIDPNTGTSIYESGDIVQYLFQTYGEGMSPSSGLLESTLFTGWIPTLLRAGRGMTLWERSRDEPPPKKLQLFSYENNPYARIVREALCELELPYILHNVGKGSRREKLLLDKSGKSQVPYLIDPNTNVGIGDYKEIISYLFQTYSSETS